MKEIVNNFLLARDTFMPKINLNQTGFTYSACKPFVKKTPEKEVKNFKETGDLQHFHQSKLDKSCFQHDMVEVYNRYFWPTSFTCNFQINKKANSQTLKFLSIPPNISMTPIHTKK